MSHKFSVTIFPALVFSISIAAYPQIATVTSQSPLIEKLKTPDRVQDVRYSPDGRLLAAGFGWNVQGGARIWRTSDNTVLADLAFGEGDDANVERVSFSNDGKLFAISNWHGDVLMWEVGTWTKQKKILSQGKSAESLSFSPDSQSLLLATEDVVIIYDLPNATSRTIARKEVINGPIVSATFSKDGETIIVFGNSTIRAFSRVDGKQTKTPVVANTSFFGTVSADGRFFISGGGAIYGPKSIEIRSASDGKKISEISGFRSGLFTLTVSALGERFAVAGGDYGGGDMSVWSTSDAREIGYASFGNMPIQAVAFSPNEKVLAAGSDDGYVLLYAVDRLNGPEVKKQTYPLCGEIIKEDEKVYVVPIAKVPGVMPRQGFRYNWKLQVANGGKVSAEIGIPVSLDDWSIESSSAEDRIRIDRIRALAAEVDLTGDKRDYIIFGDIQNPGWNEGFLTKIYSDGTFVTTNNPGRCLVTGSLAQLGTDFLAVKNRLIKKGIMALAKEPLTPDAAHFRTRFIELTVDGEPELRTDAEDIQRLLNGGQPKKREAFSLIYSTEEVFINSLRSIQGTKIGKRRNRFSIVMGNHVKAAVRNGKMEFIPSAV